MAIPIRMNLKRDEKLEIQWEDGRTCVYPLALLRAKCPCAKCKAEREELARKKTMLRVLQGNYEGPLVIVHAELVGNYALQIAWSDNHDTGIYSFEYLRKICPDEGTTGQ